MSNTTLFLENVRIHAFQLTKDARINGMCYTEENGCTFELQLTDDGWHKVEAQNPSTPITIHSLYLYTDGGINGMCYTENGRTFDALHHSETYHYYKKDGRICKFKLTNAGWDKKEVQKPSIRIGHTFKEQLTDGFHIYLTDGKWHRCDCLAFSEVIDLLTLDSDGRIKEIRYVENGVKITDAPLDF